MSKNKNRNLDRPSKEPEAPASANPGTTPATESPLSPFLVRWFLSQTVRQATAMRKHVQKLLNHQRDILTPQAIQGIESPVLELCEALHRGAEKSSLEKLMEKLEAAANKWLKPYPNPA